MGERGIDGVIVDRMYVLRIFAGQGGFPWKMVLELRLEKRETLSR